MTDQQHTEHPRSLVRVRGVHGRDFPYDWALDEPENSGGGVVADSPASTRRLG